MRSKRISAGGQIKGSWQHQELIIMQDKCLPYDREEIEKVCHRYGCLMKNPALVEECDESLTSGNNNDMEDCLFMHKGSYDIFYKAQKYDDQCKIEGTPN